MKQLVNYSKLTLALLVTFGEQVLKVFKGLSIPEIETCAYYNNAFGLFAKMQDAFNREQRSKFSQQVRLADGKRDNLFRGIKHRLRGFLISENEAERTAAQLIWRIIERNGISLDKMKLNTESSNLNKLLAELKLPDGVAALQLLGLTAVFALLAVAQQEFENLYQSRGVDDTERKEYDAASTIRLEFEEALELLLKYTESQAMVNPTSKWVKAHAQIVNFGEKFELDLRQSEGRTEAKAKQQPHSDTPNLSELL
jgi:hypothetical protein